MRPECACLHKTVNMVVFFVQSNENASQKGELSCKRLGKCHQYVCLLYLSMVPSPIIISLHYNVAIFSQETLT